MVVDFLVTIKIFFYSVAIRLSFGTCKFNAGRADAKRTAETTTKKKPFFSCDQFEKRLGQVTKHIIYFGSPKKRNLKI